ncbi:unnamed protein product [Blepharisma stoltei]|uniref:Uncharacterized protein n=1 Tax=Blepharisma stoltei TaxID=1481888 RepID=A0AAU9JY95_9CILI|nr:unnamed protein product [Blepharisma stoltei]
MSWNNPPPGVNPQYSSFYYNSQSFAPPSQPQVPQPTDHKRGVPGGGWDDGTEELHIRRSRNPAPIPNQTERPPVVQETVIQHIEKPVHQNTTIAVSLQPGPYERKLVDDITIPGGARPRPSDKDLHDFSQKCMFLSHEMIGNLLLQTLQHPQRSLKALYVLDTLASDYPTYKDFVVQNLSAIQAANYSQAHQKALQSLLSKLNSSINTTAPSFSNIIEF